MDLSSGKSIRNRFEICSDSTSWPTVGQLVFRAGDRPTSPEDPAPPGHLGGLSSPQDDPAHICGERRSPPVWRPSGGWHAARRATAQS